METKQQCSVRVWIKHSFGRYRNCSKPVTAVVDGVPYCSIHDPAAEAKRLAATTAQWEKDKAKRQMEWAAPDLYSALEACQLQLLQMNNPHEYVEEALNLAHAALKKARGEQ